MSIQYTQVLPLFVVIGVFFSQEPLGCATFAEASTNSSLEQTMFQEINTWQQDQYRESHVYCTGLITKEQQFTDGEFKYVVVSHDIRKNA